MAKQPKKINLNDKDNDFTGGNKAEIINAKGGDDSISGGGGNDKINGGEGNDVLKGGSGDDKLNGGAGNDILRGGAGDDTMVAKAGDDDVDGGVGDDTVVLTGTRDAAQIIQTGEHSYEITTTSGTTKVSNVELFKFEDGTVSEEDLVDTTASFTLTASPATVTEGDAGTKTVTMTLTLDSVPTEDVTISYATLLSGTASANDDFIPASGTVTFLAGSATATVSIEIVGDNVFEPDETINLEFTGAVLTAPATGTITITEDDTSTQGQTFTLTEGSDTIPGLIGNKGSEDNTGDDVIVAGLSSAGGPVTNTLGSGDALDGGTGDDELRIIDEGSTITPNLANIEVVTVQATAPGATTLNMINANGVEELWNFDSVDGGDLVVDEINDDLVLGFDSTQGDIDATFDNDVILDGAIDVAVMGSGEEPSSAGNTAFNNEGAVLLSVDTTGNDGVETVNVVATGDASRLVIDTVDGDDDILTLNISGDADLFIDTDDIAFSLDTITSTSTGSVTIIANQNDTDLVVTTGVGDDELVMDAETFDVDDDIDLGAGDNTLNLQFSNFADLDTVVAGDNDLVDGINDAAGVGTLVIDMWDSGNQGILLDASDFTTITDFVFDDTNDGANFTQDDLEDDIDVFGISDDDTFTINTNLNGSAYFEADTDEDILNLTLAGNVTGDTDGDDGINAFGFDNINLVADGDIDIVGGAGSPGNFSQSGMDVDDGTEILITGEGDVLLRGVDADGVVIDASGLDGEAMIEGSWGEDDITGSANDDVLQGDQVDILEGNGGVAQAQQSNVALGGTLQTGDVYTVNIEGTDYSYTVQSTDASLADVATGLAAAIGNAGGEIGSATANGSSVDLVGLPDGSQFNFQSSTQDAGATADTATISVANELYDATDVVRVTIDGTNYDFTVAAEDTSNLTVAAGIVALINAGAQATAVDNGDGTFDITGTTLGDNLTFTASMPTDDASDTATTLTITPADFETGETLLVNLNGQLYSEAWNTDVTTTLTNFANNHGAAILAQTGGTITNSGGTALLITLADGEDFTDGTDAGNTSATITGGDGGTAPDVFVDGEPDLDNTDPTVTDNNTASVANPNQTATDTTNVVGIPADDTNYVNTAADTYTGGDGDDLFIVAAGDVTDAGADVITDFSAGDELSFVFVDSNGDDTAETYAEVTAGNFAGALSLANSLYADDFTVGNDLLEFVAVQVGTDTYIFADADNDDFADDVVRLDGVSLDDLANDGKFIVDAMLV